MIFKNSRFMVVYIGLIVLAIDFITKFLVAHFIPVMSYDSLWYPYGGIGIFNNLMGIEFSIVHVTNRGAAWSTLESHQDALLIIRTLLIFAMLAYLLFINKNKESVIPLVLIVSGAIGNVLDFFLYGHVVDMIYFIFWGHPYPVFNVADSAVTIGVLWLVLSSLWNSKKAKVRA